MDWKERRYKEGWRLQSIWLKPKSVEIIDKNKEETGKTLQEIINELITNETDDNKTPGKLEKIIEGKIKELKEEIREETLELIEKKLEVLNPKYSLDHREEVIELIKEERNKGKPLTQISNLLNERGFKTEKKNEWTRKSLKRFISQNLT